MKNQDLKAKYDEIYASDAYKTFFSFSSFPQMKLITEMIPEWGGLDVLEIGCGEGRLAAMLSFAGVNRVDAVDFSSESIRIAKSTFNIPNVNFLCQDYREVEGQYDVVVLDGVLEHFDHPFEELHHVMETFLKPEGLVVNVCPSFINPRGYVWMALHHLLKVPMSLTDLHFLCPFDFEEFCEKHDYALEYRSTYQDWGAGERTIIDFNKRLRNALRDAGLDNSGVDDFLDWFRKAVKSFNTSDATGAAVAYKISKPSSSLS